MTLPSTEDVVENPPATGDADETIRTELPCACGYDLRGLTRSGRCPECGQDIATAVACNASPIGPPATLRRMTRGLVIVLVAYIAWLIVLCIRGLLEGVDGWAYWATGVSGVKAFIVPASFITARPQNVLTWLVPACHVVHIVGVLLLTTPPALGRAPLLRWRAVTLRWASVAMVPFLAVAYPLWASRYAEMLGWLSVADVVLGLTWGLYLAGLARTLRRARWLRIGAWILAIGSIACGGTFASAFLAMVPQQTYWETVVRTSLIGWAAVGLLGSSLLALAWVRLRRDLRAMNEAESA